MSLVARRTLGWSKLALALLALSLPSLAAADEAAAPKDAPAPPASDPAREKALVEFREGVALMAANDWAAAVIKLKSAGRFAMSAQVAYNIAECERHLGKLVSALGNYRLALAKAEASKVENVLAAAPAQIEALEKRIVTLTVTRKEEKPNPRATIELDGVELGPSQIGKAFRTDPGERTFRVLVGGEAVTTERVKLSDGEVREVKLTIPVPTALGGGADEDAAGGPSIPGIVLTAFGGASLIAGGVFIGLRQAAISELDDLCGGDTSCPPSAEPTADRGRLMTGLAEVFFPVGAAAAVTGIVLIATMSGGKKAEETPAVSLLAPDGNGPGLGLSGRF